MKTRPDTPEETGAYAAVAQLEEQPTCNRQVQGSTPCGCSSGTKHGGEFSDAGACAGVVFRTVDTPPPSARGRGGHHRSAG